jgi:hypothetical protein
MVLSGDKAPSLTIVTLHVRLVFLAPLTYFQPANQKVTADVHEARGKRPV